MSTNINNLAPLYYILNHIYIKNPFNFNFVPLNHSINNILTFINPILLILILKVTPLPYN